MQPDERVLHGLLGRCGIERDREGEVHQTLAVPSEQVADIDRVRCGPVARTDQRIDGHATSAVCRSGASRQFRVEITT